MNSVTKDIMKLLKVDETDALEVQNRMDQSGINYSECSKREFNAEAREAFKIFKGECTEFYS